MPEPPPLDTLETRLVRIEALVEDIKERVHAVDVGRDQRLIEIRERLDAQFDRILQGLDVIKAKTRA